MGFFKQLGTALSSGSFLGGALQTAGSLYMNNKNIEFQERQNEINRRYQQDMIADERAYNDPSAQMKRLEAAGINTTFAGMNTDISSGSQVGSQSPVQGVAPSMANPLDGASQIGVNIANEQSMQTEAKTRVGELQVAREQLEISKSDISKLNEVRDMDIDKKREELRQISTNIDKTLIECGILKSQKDCTDLDALLKMENLNMVRMQFGQQKFQNYLFGVMKDYYFKNERKLRPIFENPRAFSYAFVPSYYEAMAQMLRSRSLDIDEYNAESNRIGAQSSSKMADTGRLEYDANKPVYDATAAKIDISNKMADMEQKFWSEHPFLYAMKKVGFSFGDVFGQLISGTSRYMGSRNIRKGFQPKGKTPKHSSTSNSSVVDDDPMYYGD